MNGTIDLFFCYSHKDKGLRDELEKHLAVLKRSGAIRGWHDRRIVPGEDWKNAIDEHLQAAHVIVPLISADFLDSDYCYDVEMKRALERLEQGTARVVPIVLRGCDWKDSPLGRLQALPATEKPVKNWRNRDKAWADVVRGLREVFGQISAAARAPSPAIVAVDTMAEGAAPSPASIRIYVPCGGLRSVLTEAKDTLVAEGLADEFEPPATKHWQHKHSRVGWRLFVANKRQSFAFVGIWEGEPTIHKGVPDLYFFLEMSRGTSAQKAFDARGSKIKKWISDLGSKYPEIKWGYDPGGWESSWAVKSLVDVAKSDDVRMATIDFFRTCMKGMRECGLLDEFLLHARAW